MGIPGAAEAWEALNDRDVVRMKRYLEVGGEVNAVSEGSPAWSLLGHTLVMVRQTSIRSRKNTPRKAEFSAAYEA